MLAAILDPLRRFLANPQLPWIMLWVGLAFLIVTLIVMIRTSWGQSRPLRKCAALSLLAHLLLAVYATTIEIVTGSGFGGTGNGTMNVVLINDSYDGPEGVGELLGDPDSTGGNDEITEPGLDPAENPQAVDTVAQHEHPSSQPPLLTPPPDAPTTPPPLLDAVEPPTDTPPEEDVAAEDPSEPTDQSPPDAPAAPTTDPAAPLANLPDPPTTSEPGDWVSGQPADAAQANTADKPLVDVVAAPIASRAVPEIYAQRVAKNRAQLLIQNGGSPESEAAVQNALNWLAGNQSADGRWDADRFGAGRETGALGHNRQGAGANADTGITGLALLAFLGAGETHLQGDHAETVRRGLEFLIASQRSDGNLASGAETYAFMYCHGMATLALSEAYAMTGDQRLESPLRRAVAYTLAAQHPSTGGWRYRPGDLGDTSQLGWQLMAIKSAQAAGIEIPQRTTDAVQRFLRSVSSGRSGGIAAYRPGERPTRPMTAEALVCRQFLGLARDNPAANEAGDYLLAELPTPERINLYYWYYGSLAMFQLQGPHWEQWNRALQTTLVRRQRGDGDLSGSWDPECIWGGYGGRVYSTAMSALCLEVYYRYLPLYRVANRP